MYAAINRQGELVYASNTHCHETYYCPNCRQIVWLKCSCKGTYYFAHKAKCQSNRSLQFKGETELHQKVKRIISKRCHLLGIECQIEHLFPKTNQRADIFLPERNCVIEYQHSIIPVQDIALRSKQYQQLGLHVEWLIDWTPTLMDSSWGKSFLQYSQNKGLYVMGCDWERENIHCIYPLPVMSNQEPYEIQTQSLIQWLNQSEEWRCRKIDPTKRNKSHVIGQIMRNTQYYSILQKLYQSGTTLQQLPPWMLERSYHTLLCKGPMWQVWAWSYNGYSQLPKIFTTHQFVELIKQSILQGNIPLVTTPLLMLDAVELLSRAILTIFQQKSLVRMIGHDMWAKCKEKD